MTPLQAALRALVDVMEDARENLGDEAYSWFVAITTEMVGIEASRLAVGEALREQRRAA